MFSLCITTYNRFDMLVESFEQALDDRKITEIVISDDCSDWTLYNTIQAYCKQYPKIKLFRNEKNVGMSLNKLLAVTRATEDWCIILDSDNKITKEYIHALYMSHRYPTVINVPDAGYQEDPERPRLDYRRFGKWYISRANIRYFLNFPQAEMLLNTCNYCVNRKYYMAVYQENQDIKASDTIWFNYLWLKQGGAFVVVPGMRYYHRIHAGSGFMQNLAYNTQSCEEILERIKAL